MTSGHSDRSPPSAALLPSHFQSGTGSLVAPGAASLPAVPARAPQDVTEGVVEEHVETEPRATPTA